LADYHVTKKGNTTGANIAPRNGLVKCRLQRQKALSRNIFMNRKKTQGVKKNRRTIKVSFWKGEVEMIDQPPWLIVLIILIVVAFLMTLRP